VEGARAATSADVPRLVELARVARAELEPLRGGSVFVNREARGEPLDAGFERALADPAQTVVVGTVDEVIVGYGTGRTEQLRDERRLGIIDDLFVEDGFRSVGVGEAVMEALLEWFRAQSCDGVDAMALPGARETKNFFETAGFTARLLVVHHRLT
jgi:GNAT superfamily N-acetyltransferase